MYLPDLPRKQQRRSPAPGQQSQVEETPSFCCPRTQYAGAPLQMWSPHIRMHLHQGMDVNDASYKLVIHCQIIFTRALRFTYSIEEVPTRCFHYGKLSMQQSAASRNDRFHLPDRALIGCLLCVWKVHLRPEYCEIQSTVYD